MTKTTKKPTIPTFKPIHRYDEDKAANGVAHYIQDRNGNKYPVWTVRFVDPYNKGLNLHRENYQAFLEAEGVEFEGEEPLWHSFSHMCVVGWNNMPDDKGNEIEFHPEIAFHYLKANPWFRETLLDRAQDERYYAKLTPAATKVQDLGN